MSRSALLSLIAITAIVPRSPAQSSKMQLESLAIIPGVYVEIDGITPEATADGLSADSLRVDIETLLDRADILSLTKPEWQQTIGNPGLHLSMQLLRVSEHLYIYGMTLEVRQLARLMRDSTKLVYTRTWDSGSVVGTVPTNAITSLRARIRPLVRRFISDYDMAGQRVRRRATGWNSGRRAGGKAVGR